MLSPVWRTTRRGAVAGLLLGAAGSCAIFIASPHVPLGPNVLWLPGGGVVAGGAFGALAGLLRQTAQRRRAS